MSTFRENIFIQLEIDLQKLKVSNGYNFDWNFILGYRDLTQGINLPCVCYWLGSETIDNADENNSLHKCISEINFLFYFTCNENNLVNEVLALYEKVIHDAKAFLHSWKQHCFEYYKIKDRTNNEYATNLIIENIQPFDIESNAGSILITARIEYYESTNSEQQPLPDVPILLYPANLFNSGKLRQEFNWNANAECYEIQIANDIDFQDIFVSQDNLRTSSYTIPLDLSLINNNTYYWRVRAKNISGNSQFSEVRSFIVNENNYDTDLQYWLQGLTPQPSQSRIELMNSLITDLKSLGIWDKLDCIWIMAAETEQQACKNLKRNKFNLIPVNSITFTINKGYKGNGSNMYLKTGTAPAHQLSYSLNSASFGLYCNTNYNETASSVDMGCAETTVSSRYSMLYIRWSNQLYTSINDNGSTPNYANSNSIGMFAIDRHSSSQYKVYRNGVSIGTASIPSSGLGEFAFTIGARNFNGTIDRFCNKQYAFAFVGSSLSASEHSSFYNLVYNYLTQIGGA